MLHGASGATIMTAGLASASVLWPTRFGEQSGKLLGMAAIGGLLGPVLGGLLFSWGEASAFGVLALITLMVCPVMATSMAVIGGANEHTSSTVSIGVFSPTKFCSVSVSCWPLRPWPPGLLRLVFHFSSTMRWG